MKPIAYDKKLHLAVGAGAVLACFLIGLVICWAFPLLPRLHTMVSFVTIGMAGISVIAFEKEEYDRRRPATHTKDGWDAYATTMGGVWTGVTLIGAVLAYLLHVGG